MNRCIANTIMVLGLVAVGILFPASALATDKYFCADTNNTWSGANWQTFAPGQDCTDGTATSTPTADDRATIISGKTCNVDITTAEADSLNVESSATLNILAGKKLKLDDDADSDTTIAGTLYLKGRTPSWRSWKPTRRSTEPARSSGSMTMPRSASRPAKR